MQLQYTASSRYRLRSYYRRTLKALQATWPIQWREEPRNLGCSSIESDFIIDCPEELREEVERKLLARVPVFDLDQWHECMQQQPAEHINIAGMIEDVKPARIRLW